MHIYVGSLNPLKINATKDASSCCSNRPLVHGESVESIVNKQPFGFSETYRGAQHRARTLKERHADDITVGIENGIFNFETVWMDIAVIVVCDVIGNEILTTSPCLLVPKERVLEAQRVGFDKQTVGAVIAQASNGKANKHDPHLFYTGISRREYLSFGIRMALSQTSLVR